MKSFTRTILSVISAVSLYSAPGFSAPNMPIIPDTLTTASVMMTLNVTHIAQNVAPNHSVHCPLAARSPTSWTGNSPVKNGTLNGAETFYPYGPTSSSNGYVVYNCSETYWSTDPYYIQLTSETNRNPTVPCQSSSYYPELCTILGKDNNSLSGVLPIHFIIKTPAQTMVRNDNYSNYNRVGYMTIASMPNIIGISVPGGGWAQEFSGLYTTGSNYAINIAWQATYTQSDGGGNGYTIGGAGNSNVLARCPDYSPFPNAGYFRFTITNDMLGKTCELSCDEKAWKRYGPSNGDPALYMANTTVYFTAPLSMKCY